MKISHDYPNVEYRRLLANASHRWKRSHSSTKNQTGGITKKLNYGEKYAAYLIVIPPTCVSSFDTTFKLEDIHVSNLFGKFEDIIKAPNSPNVHIARGKNNGDARLVFQAYGHFQEISTASNIYFATDEEAGNVQAIKKYLINVNYDCK